MILMQRPLTTAGSGMDRVERKSQERMVGRKGGQGDPWLWRSAEDFFCSLGHATGPSAAVSAFDFPFNLGVWDPDTVTEPFHTQH